VKRLRLLLVSLLPCRERHREREREPQLTHTNERTCAGRKQEGTRSLARGQAQRNYGKGETGREGRMSQRSPGTSTASSVVTVIHVETDRQTEGDEMGIKGETDGGKERKMRE